MAKSQDKYNFQYLDSVTSRFNAVRKQRWQIEFINNEKDHLFPLISIPSHTYNDNNLVKNNIKCQNNTFVAIF